MLQAVGARLVGKGKAAGALQEAQHSSSAFLLPLLMLPRRLRVHPP